MNWRRSEWISIGTLLTLALYIWWAGVKTNSWDEAVIAIKEMKPTVDEHSKELAVLIANVGDIKDDLRYLRRHSDK